MDHLTGVSNQTLVPPGATAIKTLLAQVQWQKYLPQQTWILFLTDKSYIRLLYASIIIASCLVDIQI